MAHFLIQLTGLIVSDSFLHIIKMFFIKIKVLCHVVNSWTLWNKFLMARGELGQEIKKIRIFLISIKKKAGVVSIWHSSLSSLDSLITYTNSISLSLSRSWEKRALMDPRQPPTVEHQLPDGMMMRRKRKRTYQSSHPPQPLRARCLKSPRCHMGPLGLMCPKGQVWVKSLGGMMIGHLVKTIRASHRQPLMMTVSLVFCRACNHGDAGVNCVVFDVCFE